MKHKFVFLGPFLVLLAGVFWGSMGLFVRPLAEYGFNSIQIVSIRLTLAALFFCLLQLLREPSGFRIRGRDIPLFLGLGLASILFFTVCYFTAIARMPLSTAAILLYTSPIWVMLLSVVLFKEPLNGKKLLALALAFGGCVLVSGGSAGGLDILGLLIGLGAGIGYGLYSILGSFALRRYSPFTVTTYTFLIAAAGSWLINRPAELLACFRATPSTGALLGFCLLMALVTAVVPFLSYTLGLQTVEASRAAILATVEPMVATLFGFFVFREAITPGALTGIVLILSAVVLLNLRARSGAAGNLKKN